jgi:anaerobic selenocysteine-containing dehydrogenase
MKENNNENKNGMNRRDFFKTTALLGGTGLLASTVSMGETVKDPSIPTEYYHLNDAENVIYSVCLQCHTDCPIKVKHLNGVAVKIDGNPYSMQTLNPAIPYKTDIKDAAQIDGGICPKGQAGIQSLYDPYRITKVLKRAGKRGENKWEVIAFDKAISEIVNGGKLFSKVPGEENRLVTGLKNIYKLRDQNLSKDMAKDAMDVGKGKMSVAKFKKKYRKNLDLLINPDQPDLGPINNQFVFQAGRIEHGRKEFAQRFLKGGFGSNNWFEHTTICEQSHHIAYKQLTNQYNKGKWSGGKDHMKPDFYNSEFVIIFGTSPVEANFGPPYMSNLLTNNIVSGQLKIVVVDPRLSKTATKAWKWLPVNPGSDAALAYGLMRWLLDNNGYDKRYLINANKGAALADNETTWTNSSYLVKIEKDGPGALLRGSDIGKGSKDRFVVMKNGKPVVFDPYDKIRNVEGDLFYDGKIGKIKVKSAFQLLKEYAFSKSIDQWAKECGIEKKDIIEVAKEYKKHGKKSATELYRGAVQHTSGYYNAQAIITLNLLAGNPDWKGGITAGGGHWHEDGSKPGEPFNLKKAFYPNNMKSFGHKINREGSFYENSTYFQKEGYPAKRPWFPHTGNVYQEIIPSAQVGYPYKIKALMTHKGTPVLSSPAGNKMIEALLDFDKVPLYFASDIVIGETSMYADYIFPDTAIWERWGFPHTTPADPVKQSKTRQPTVEPLVEKVKVFGEEMHVNMEAVMLAIAEKLNLPGYGKDGFGPGMDFNRQEDFYLKMTANIAAGDKPGNSVPDATLKEMKIFFKARRHFSKTVLNEKRFQKSVTDKNGVNWWKKVVYILNKGGRMEDFDAYRKSGKKVPHKFGKMFNVYVENVALTKHPYTGKRFLGIAPADPVKGYNDKPVDQGNYPLKLITYKEIIGGQSRTLPNDYWLSAIEPENSIIINAETAKEYGLRNGDMVKVVASGNPEGVWDLKNGRKKPVAGKVKVVQGLRPGVVSISWSYGHWAYGSNDVHIDGELIPGEKKRAAGLCPNAVMHVDPILKNVSLEDLIGGSASYYDSKVNLIKLR